MPTATLQAVARLRKAGVGGLARIEDLNAVCDLADALLPILSSLRANAADQAELGGGDFANGMPAIEDALSRLEN